MRQVKFWALSALMAACMYLGFVHGIVGFRRLAIFWAWFCGVCYFLLLPQDDANKKLRDKGRPANKWAMRLYDAVVVTCFVWFGYYATSVAYLMTTLVEEHIYEEDDKEDDSEH